VDAVLESDAGGIGLFRSEFLYLGRNQLPTEEEQFHTYQQILKRMGEKRVILRTLDIGSDKQADYLHLEKEVNPAMGLRAIRLCFQRPDLFRTQLRAIYRASIYGNLGILFPMITSLWELEKVFRICGEVKEKLQTQSMPFRADVPVGIMIETPAAALISDCLVKHVNFFSVGTNDLTQYTLACDRQNEQLERYCDAHHEAILRLIEMTATAAHKHNVWIGICGELAADKEMTAWFLDHGIDELSVSPNNVLELRAYVRQLDK